ncbi:small cell adhesion glycoprotein [Bombina bombina]|uniref:small cell adhesion glycoprotein n=1 Tax=Bombina bombina TaxID=8345 RepID=UPI00235A520B|nr:small cell adhesion glycoprotein [Bombina bombina]XP_053564200.1 small cell adhesion glycoprotein [Bombina bombina]XP_053564201.1 small cell adhesion glycoprotein [Bombina bombina]
MGFAPTSFSEAALTPPLFKATTSSSTDVEGFDIGVIAGVIAAVFVTLLTALVLITIYLYKHKGSYRTNENPEEEASKALQMEHSTSSQDKQEYFL